ncbi:CPBP family intramembrane glutamic endopeptidase [Microbacterium sulfonylureivorans]|uniref:CPBP family intramembrane glutamic endopeptidase n=1 Tax=Microbacterium sulfonylureivorans TaxID=2486854 RepID=UPI000FD704FF|nr:CPBP family intramembrane glutamic endopeptidase [Microbacterium sulfonylureivorans]
MSATTAAPVTPGPRAVTGSPSLAWGIALPALRVVMVALACTLAWVVVGLTAGWTAFPPTPLVATVAMLPVNLICLALVVRRLRAEGTSARALIGYRPGALGRDIAWGMLWLAVLSVPFILTIVGMMWLLHGPGALTQFETVFVDSDAMPAFSPAVSLVLAIVAVLTFAPLNAPTEELVYRGHAQRAIASRRPLPLAILIPSVLFGLQHAWYAPTFDAVLVYVSAFFVWGVGSGIIAWRQGRLLPLIIAHGTVNLFTTLPALVVPFLPIGAS